VVVLVVTAPYLSAAQAPFGALETARARSTATPLYDALVNEYRLAMRTVPGDRGPEEHVGDILFPRGYGLVPVARRAPRSLPRQVSRHRRASGDGPAYY